MTNRARRIRVEVTWGTFLKAIVLIVLALLLRELGPILMSVLVAGLLALSFGPLLKALERRLPRGLSILGIVLITGGLVVALIVLVLPPLVEQSNRVLQSWPHFKSSMIAQIPERGPMRHMVDLALSEPMRDVGAWIPKLLDVGQYALAGFFWTGLTYILMIYFLVDGGRLFRWVKAFFRPETRSRLDETAEAVTPLVAAYMVGQFITSVCCALFVYILLRALAVPAAVMLAVLAGVFDVLPIVGFFLSVIPSLVFALTVSPQAAAIVLAAYGAYHLFENYALVPRVYGDRLRLSGLSVLLGLLVAGEIAGVGGALIILPLLAAYPIVERIWLAEYVGARTIDHHTRIDSTERRQDAESKRKSVRA